MPGPRRQLEHRLGQKTPDHHDRDDRQDRAEERHAQQGDDIAAFGHQGHHRQNRGDGDVLEQQHGESDAPHPRDHIALVAQHLQDDGRRRQRQGGAEDQRCLRRDAHRPRRPGDQERADDDLGGAELEDFPAHGAQPLQRQLEPQREQQEDDADLRQLEGAAGFLDHAEAVGADGGTERQVADHRTDLYALDLRREDHGREDDQRVEKVVMVHGVARSSAPMSATARAKIVRPSNTIVYSTRPRSRGKATRSRPRRDSRKRAGRWHPENP